MRHPLVAHLSRFNRKERYALIGDALGQKPFTPSYAFVHRYLHACGLAIAGPSEAWCWMDYHLDWVWAALRTVNEEFTGQHFDSPGWTSEKGPQNVNGNVEDTDLLMAVTDGDELHLFFIEAKWQTGWTTKQMASKLVRLNHLLSAPELADGWRGVHPHLVLTSPVESAGLAGGLSDANVAPWLRNGALPFVALQAPKRRRKLVRTDGSAPLQTGAFWTVTETDSTSISTLGD